MLKYLIGLFFLIPHLAIAQLYGHYVDFSESGQHEYYTFYSRDSVLWEKGGHMTRRFAEGRYQIDDSILTIRFAGADRKFQNSIDTSVTGSQDSITIQIETLDEQTGEPYPYASCFLLHTFVGMNTDVQGHGTIVVPRSRTYDALIVNYEKTASVNLDRNYTIKLYIGKRPDISLAPHGGVYQYVLRLAHDKTIIFLKDVTGGSFKTYHLIYKSGEGNMIRD